MGMSAPPQFTPTSSSSNAPPITVSSTPVTTSTSSKKLPATTYMELHLSKLKNTGGTYNTACVVPKSQQQVFRKSMVGTAGGGGGGGGEKPATTSEGGYLKHNSPPEGNVLGECNRDSSMSVIVHHPSNELMQLEAQAVGPGGPGNSMSMTWPRSNLGCVNGGGGVGGGLTSVPPLKGPTQINADALGVAGGKYCYVIVNDVIDLMCMQFRAR